MMRLFLVILFDLFLAMVVVVGCGDDDASSDSESDTDADTDTDSDTDTDTDSDTDVSQMINELTPDELLQLCIDGGNMMSAAVPPTTACQSEGVVSELGGGPVCEEVYKQCMTEGWYDDWQWIPCDVTELPYQDFSGCDLTVSDFNQCIEDNTNYLEELANDYSCEATDEFHVSWSPESCSPFMVHGEPCAGFY